MNLIAWLLGSKTGRIVAACGLALMAGILALSKAYTAGQERERRAAAQASLTALRNRIKTDDEISRLSRADRIERLRSWTAE